jgi:hypothetical protein
MNFISENIETLTQLENQFPNNMELGNNLRRLFGDNEYIISIFNDQDLGKEVRRIIKDL